MWILISQISFAIASRAFNESGICATVSDPKTSVNPIRKLWSLRVQRCQLARSSVAHHKRTIPLPALPSEDQARRFLGVLIDPKTSKSLQDKIACLIVHGDGWHSGNFGELAVHRNPGPGLLNPFCPCATHSTRHMSQPDARLN